MYIEIDLQRDSASFIERDFSGWVIRNGENGQLIYRKIGDSPFFIDKEDSTYILLRKNDVVLKRGFSGEQPLFYTVSASKLFVSDCVVRLAERIHASMCLVACYEFVFFEYSGEGRTLFEGVKAVLNGQSLTFRTDLNGGVAVSTVDSFSLPQLEGLCSDEQKLASLLREHINTAHASRSGSVNGVLLSGGIDSQVMAISLSRDLGLKSTFAATFSVRGARQTETEDAKLAAKQLGLEWFHVEVDPAAEIEWSDVLRANSPYIGSLAMSQFLPKIVSNGKSGSVLFAGQDTRLHTPALGPRDLLLWKGLYRFERFSALVSRCAQGVGYAARELDESVFLKRVLGLFAHSPSFSTFLANRYFHVRRFDFNKNDQIFSRVFSDIVRSLKNPDPLNPRAAYNKIVGANWRRQYLFDIGHMEGSCRHASLNCVLPFYDHDLSVFSAKLPFELATKVTVGRAGHSHKEVKVNKYLLRKAYEKDLDPVLIYRDKAVCATNHLFFNGSLRGVLSEFSQDSEHVFSDMGIALHMPDIQRMCKIYDGKWTEDDNWLCNIVFNTLVVWSLIAKKSTSEL